MLKSGSEIDTRSHFLLQYLPYLTFSYEKHIDDDYYTNTKSSLMHKHLSFPVTIYIHNNYNSMRSRGEPIVFLGEIL